jgi:hypothetical protein
MLAGVPYVACLVIIDGREHKTVTFRRSFWLKGVDRLLPPADYRVVTDEELIEGLSFSAYHRISTAIFVPAPSGSAIEMVTIDPLDLEAALERDAASPPG